MNRTSEDEKKILSPSHSLTLILEIYTLEARKCFHRELHGETTLFADCVIDDWTTAAKGNGMFRENGLSHDFCYFSKSMAFPLPAEE